MLDHGEEADAVISRLLAANGVADDPDLRGQAVRALKNMAIHLHNAEATTAAHDVTALVPLLELQQMALLTLRALGIMMDSPEARVAFVDARGVPRLLPLMDDGPSSHPEAAELRKQAGRILVTLAGDPNISRSVFTLGGASAIVNLAEHDDPEVQEEFAWALACLSGDATGARVVCEAGALPVLLRLSASPRRPIQLQAVWALANLAVANPVKKELHDMDVVLTVVAQINAILDDAAGVGRTLDDSAVLAKLVRCLANLLVYGDTHAALVRCGGVAALLRVADDGTGADGDHTDALASVGRALANLTFESEMAGEAVRAGALPALVAMLGNDSPSVLMEAISAVLNISAATLEGAAADQCVHGLIAHGALEALVALLRSSDAAVVQEQVALALANLALSESSKQHVLHLNALVHLRRLRVSSGSPRVVGATTRVLEVLGE